MECLKCYNDMFLDYIVFNLEREDYNIEIKKVPALVCSSCKETYIENIEMDKIFNAVIELDGRIKDLKLKN